MPQSALQSPSRTMTPAEYEIRGATGGSTPLGTLASIIAARSNFAQRAQRGQ